jgi:small nuclear ribonucleoprotein (snRNP)-like protein
VVRFLQREFVPAMSEAFALQHELDALIGLPVILDVKGRHVYIGTLEKVGKEVIVLSNADVHFCDDSQTTAELYLLETKKNGIRANRATVYVMRSEVLSISRLDDVVVY